MSHKNGKKKWIIIVAVILVVAVGIGAIASAVADKKQTTDAGGSIEFITKRTIANSITGNGTVEAAVKENVTGGSYGMKVDTVHVEEGDIVKKGDIICVFNTESVEEQMQTVKENIAETKENKKTQLKDYDQQIEDAKKSNKEDLKEAKANLKKAEEELETEKTALKKKQKEYDEYLKVEGHAATDVEATQMESIIETKKSNVETIQSRVDSYKSRVDSLEDQDTKSLEDAKKSYEEQTDETIASYEEQLDSLQEQKEDATIYAGIDGIVTAVNVSVGSNFNGGTIASIESVDQFIVEAQVEEYDVADVATGMKVLIKTDATRDLEMEGVITYVAPRATNSGDSSMNDLSSLMGGDMSSMTGSGGGAATYLVKIELKEQNERLRLGMNAKTSILTEERVDVWSVPYDAVYTREDGSTYVEQVTGKDEDGNILTTPLDIEVGLQGTYYIEVISDKITEDIEILVPDAQGNSSIEELLNMMGADAGI